MNFKQKLTHLLCECEPVREQIMEMKFGCKIKMMEDGESAYGRYICLDEHFLYQDNPEWSLFHPEEMQDYIVIGNKLELHHLFMYCKEKNIDLIIQANGVVKGFNEDNGRGGPIYTIITNLDTTKDFASQEDKVYENIFNYLSK